MFNIQYIYELVDKISPSLSKIEKNILNTNSKIANVAQSASIAINKSVVNIEKANQSIKNFGKNLSNIGKEAFVKVSLPVGLIGMKFIKDASNYAESINKVDVAFGQASQSVKKFADSAGKNFGIDRGTALDMAAMFGDMSTGMGLSQVKAAILSTSLVGLAGDLASFKNLNVSEVQTALSGIFTGETESLKRLGIVMTETNLQQFALSQGIKEKISALNQSEKVLLRYNYIIAMSKNSIGDFTRTQAGFANQTRILSSRFKDLSITLGTMILPYAIKVMEQAIKLVSYFQSLSENTQKLILIFGGLAVIITPILLVFGSLLISIAALSAGLIAISGHLKLLATLAMANPMTAFFIAAAAAAIYFKNELAAVFSWLEEKINQAKDWFSSLADKMRNIWAQEKNGFSFLANKVQSFFGNESENNLIMRNENINKNQNQIGGRLDINFANTPKGTGIEMTPIRNSQLDIGVNSIFRGSY